MANENTGAKKGTKKTTTATTKKQTNTSTKKASATKTTAKKTTTKTTAKKQFSTPSSKTEVKKPTIIIASEEAENIEAPKKKEPVIVEEKETLKTSTILGMKIPTGDTPEDRNKRSCIYTKDAMFFAIIIPIIDLLAMLFIDGYKAYPITSYTTINYCVTLLIDFTLIFILTYLVDYLHCEKAIRRMNNKK